MAAILTVDAPLTADRLVVFAGNGGAAGDVDAIGAAARFNQPFGIARDPANGNVYVSEIGSSVIRKITPAGVVTTVAGRAGMVGALKDGVFYFPTGVAVDAAGKTHVAGTDTAASFASPTRLAITAAGTIYVSDTYNNVIRRITAGGVVTTVLGHLRSDPGFEFRTGPDPRLGGPVDMAILDATHLVMAMQTFNHAVYIATVP